MNLRWLVFDYVDPALGLDVHERRRIRSAAWNLLLSNNPPGDPQRVVPLWARVVAPLVPGSGMLIVLIPLFVLQPRSWLHILWTILAQVVITWLLTALVARWTWRPAVCIALREAGHPVCIRCGYFLRGLGHDVTQCPECGEPRQPMTSASDSSSSTSHDT